MKITEEKVLKLSLRRLQILQNRKDLSNEEKKIINDEIIKRLQEREATKSE